MLPTDLVPRIVLNLVPMVLSLSVHEFSHAWVADRLGDDTPRREGRLTLSPLSHYDIFGTILVPVAAAAFGGFSFIGWARPVQVNPVRLSRRLSMRGGMAVVALAGPLSNLVLAVAAIGILAMIARFSPGFLFAQDGRGGLVYLLRAMFVVNVGLCVFNLLPIPPLDGSRLLPRSLDRLQEMLAPMSILLLLLILYSDGLRSVLIETPVGLLMSGLQRVFGITVWGATP
ncbi:MAG: site-2 protease family protein [Polyangiaceae bacterium]